MADNLNIFGTTYNNVAGIKATDTNDVVQIFIHPQATQGATTYTPTTSNQTISSGTYLTGTQTISGDANLVAGNIKNGTTIFGVTGTYSGGGGSSKNAQSAQSTTRASSSSYAELVTLTCSVAGTYDVYWSTFRTSTSGTWGSQLYINDQAYGSVQSTFTNHIQNVHLTNVSIYVGTLTIIQKS